MSKTQRRRFRRACDELRLDPWPRYENDASFRHWFNRVDETPGGYGLAWLIATWPA